MKGKVILIGGAPVSGKTYLAKKLSRELGIPWISTDTIRSQMRAIVRKEDYPALFFHEDDSATEAERFLTSYTAEQIVVRENEECEDVWKGVQALIEKYNDWESFIIEGVAVLPKFLQDLKSEKREIKPIFLVETDRERIREKIYSRGLWDEAEKYPDELKPKEVEWVLEFNKYLKSEAEKYGYPFVEIEDLKSYFEKVNQLI